MFYTGDIHFNPTVYFHDPETKRVGHITQEHDIAANIGRNLVKEYKTSYEAKNYGLMFEGIPKMLLVRHVLVMNEINLDLKSLDYNKK